MVCIAGLFVAVTCVLTGKAVVQLIKRERKFSGNGFKGFFSFLFSLSFVGFTGYCIYLLPKAFFGGASWAGIQSKGPGALIIAAFSLAAVTGAFYIHYLFATYFVHPRDKNWFVVTVFSVLNGFGNSLLIMVINEVLNRSIQLNGLQAVSDSGLIFYFVLGVLWVTVCGFLVRKRLVTLTNHLIYEKRMAIIAKILQAPYDKLEALEEGQVEAVLNNDTEVISGVVNMFVNCLTGVITIISCLIYLGTINVYGLLASVGMIGLAVWAFLTVSRKVQAAWEKNRDIQNVFFRMIHHLNHGFKELYINPRKRSAFAADMEQSCAQYRDTRLEGEFKFVKVSIFGDILFVTVIGIVVFTFGYLFPNIQGETLRTFVLVYLYMSGIVNMVIYLFPQMVRVFISWRRINGLIRELALLEPDPAPEEEADGGRGREPLTIELKNVTYQYKNADGERFQLGPISQTFHSGRICFITGGNGSGKSTLIKLITGIYRPDSGEILVNGRKTVPSALGAHFSAVFSDFHLFDKLYGIPVSSKREEIEKILKVLRIEDKLQITDGNFSTLKLSSGQRKRIALLISYLEDRQAFLFDEWAADQDPEFKKFFYQTLLPELKARGKMVIAITHDDRYYGVADEVIKMETGVILKSEK